MGQTADFEGKFRFLAHSGPSPIALHATAARDAQIVGNRTG
jgi:hypothetical protein